MDNNFEKNHDEKKLLDISDYNYNTMLSKKFAVTCKKILFYA